MGRASETHLLFLCSSQNGPPLQRFTVTGAMEPAWSPQLYLTRAHVLLLFVAGGCLTPFELQQGAHEHARTCSLDLVHAALLPLKDSCEGRLHAASRQAINGGGLHADKQL